MKYETKLRLLVMPVIIGVAVYFGAYVMDNEFHSYQDVKHSYETDETRFYNGEILLPDYVHSDTLGVVDADFLNKMIIEDKYEVQSDGDISDVLAVGCTDLHNHSIVKN